MSQRASVAIRFDGPFLTTQGLDSVSHLEVAVRPGAMVEATSELLEYVAEYVQNGHPLRPGEVMSYGYWVIGFAMGMGRLEIVEWTPDASRFTPGVELTVSHWVNQNETCRQAGATFAPPRPEQMVAISEGVLEGQETEGVRYPAPEHMSGWYWTTDAFDGDIRSLSVEHLYHVTAARPDLARYVALPPGYRFDRTSVWRDDRIGRRLE